MNTFDVAFVRRVIEELDAFASLKPPLFSSILLTRQAYLFLQQHVDIHELKPLLRGLREMQNFYRRSTPFRLLLLLIFISFSLTLTYPFLPSYLTLPLSSFLAVALAFLFLFGNSLMLKPHITQASRLFASQARKARRISQLLIKLYGQKIGALTLFYPSGARVLRRHLTFNPFLVVKFLVTPL
ncbi:MAG: hypothetical protein QXW47_01515 [Candidatus Jordarchaeales archaeon]|nr:hypothetical protein [Candidatus Jordarchaeia archaeon]